MPLLLPLVAALLLCLAPASAVRAAEPATANKVLGLEDQLKTGLRARSSEDVAFIKDVVSLVQRGELPVKLVNSTFIWAIQHQRKYPFPAFERALRIQAERIGVDL